MIKTYKNLKGRTWDQPGIPKWIFRFGNESVENLHPRVIEIYNKQLEDNPEYELFYFDTKDKLQFAQDINDPRVEATYNKLVPPAFKSDFLKFVLLYTYGGVYMDFSMEPLIPLKDIFKGYKRVLARDTPAPDGMCIGFITSEKGDELMRESMEKCIYNTTYNLYGTHILDITGPIMFSRVYKKLNHIGEIPMGKVSDDLYFYDMADALNIYDNGVPVIRLRMENHHKLLYNHEYDEDSPNNLHYHILYPKGKVFSRKISTYKDLKEKVWQEGGIPKWIFKTGPFELDELPELYKHIFLDMLDKNPSYELFYFSDADCEEFIKDNYDEEHLNAYNLLIPTAYKADFWRTLVLYKYGGCYGDFSQSMLVSFDSITEGMDRVLVLDTPASTSALYNAFMCTKAGDDVLRRTIHFIKNNIDKRHYGHDTLDITGPRVLGRAYCEIVYRNSRSSIPVGKHGTTNILNNPHESKVFIVNSEGTPMILKKLSNHWDIVYNNRGVKHYGELWHERNVFAK
jgi:mannosyltransferase OCH1-like enzyme